MPSNPKLHGPRTDHLFAAVLRLRTIDECLFFEDLCTVHEIRALAQRFRVAQMLHEGATYEAIVRETGASSATISRVKRFLDYGADGYRLILGRLAGDKTRRAPRSSPPRAR
jgi:TrpR-related protein YerC/YecD